MSLLLRKRPTSNLYSKIVNLALKMPQTAYSTKEDARIPKNVLKDHISAHLQTENGVVYDKRPYKIALEAGKKYSWCLCGKSKNQPLCDGTHKNIHLKITLKPVRFMVDESKDYWLCNCKHTNNRPFCDGTHKTKLVQDQASTMRTSYDL